MWYEAEIYECETADKIRKGLVQHVSVGADYETLDVVDGKVPHGLHNAELSLVAVPGIPETNVMVLERLSHLAVTSLSEGAPRGEGKLKERKWERKTVEGRLRFLETLQRLKEQDLSQGEVEAKLVELTEQRDALCRELEEIEALRHMPYGTAAVYAEGIRNASMERMVKLVKIAGMLLQTKVYLFWQEMIGKPCKTNLLEKH